MDAMWKLLGTLDEPAVVATLVRVVGSSPREPGARLVVFADGRVEGTLGGGSLEHKVCAEARTMLDEGATHTHRTFRLNPSTDQCCGGEVDVFLERVAPPARVLLFGAGHVGQAVARALAPLPFRVTVIDERPEYLTRERFPLAQDLLSGEPAEVLGGIPTSAELTYALIFTHSHRRDFQLVSLLVSRPLRYLGLIGSGTKWIRFRDALLERGVPKADVERIRCPIGIGVGGKSPAEIAVSVAAELLAVRDGIAFEVRKAVDLAPLPETSRKG